MFTFILHILNDDKIMNVYTASFSHLEVKGNPCMKSSEQGLGAEFMRAGLSVKTEE